MTDDLNDLSKAELQHLLNSYMLHTVPYIILAKFAHWSIILTSILMLASLLVPLPFNPLWGFFLVPLGGLVAIYVGKRANVSSRTE